jgi:hypothetical protein
VLDPRSPWASSRPLRTFRPDAARVAFAELAEPPIVVLAPDNDPPRLEAARQVVGALTAVGARATLEPASSPTLARAIGVGGYAPTFQAAIWTTPALASYDPSFLGALFGPPLRTPLNYESYASDAFDQLTAAVDAAPTLAARHSAVDRELALLARDVPVVPLYFTRAAFAFRPATYEGWRYVTGTGILDKQSFLGSPVARAGESPIANPGPVPSGQDSSAGTLLLFGAGIVGLMALAAGWRWYGGRR